MKKKGPTTEAAQATGSRGHPLCHKSSGVNSSPLRNPKKHEILTPCATTNQLSPPRTATPKASRLLQ
jgi:hypothetical protein